MNDLERKAEQLVKAKSAVDSAKVREQEVLQRQRDARLAVVRNFEGVDVFKKFSDWKNINDFFTLADKHSFLASTTINVEGPICKKVVPIKRSIFGNVVSTKTVIEPEVRAMKAYPIGRVIDPQGINDESMGVERTLYLCGDRKLRSAIHMEGSKRLIGTPPPDVSFEAGIYTFHRGSYGHDRNSTDGYGYESYVTFEQKEIGEVLLDLALEIVEKSKS